MPHPSAAFVRPLAPVLGGVVIGLAGLVGSSAVAEPIGRIESLSGPVAIERANETLTALDRMPVEQEDVIVTGAAASVGLLLNDDSTFSVGPNSQVVLDEFAYDPAAGNIGMAVSLARGSMAFLSGNIAKFRPEAATVNTPAATIGIRGTRFAIDALPGGGTVLMEDYSQPFSLFGLPPLRFEADPTAPPAFTVVLLAEADGSVGAIEVANDAGALVIDSPGGAVTVGPRDRAPADMFKMSEAEVDRRYGPALIALPSAPLTFELFFEPGSTILTAASEAVLQEVMAAIAERESDNVLLAGHTDTVASDASNRRLSLERAAAVRDSLIAAGVDAAAISEQSFGESEPAVPTPDGVAELRNRRVEVRIR